MPNGFAAKFSSRQKEDLHAGQNYRGVGEEARVGLVAEAQYESVGGEQQRPEQQRTFLPGPEHGELIRTGKIAVAVVEDVGDGEVVLEGADDEDDAKRERRRRKLRCRRGGRFRRCAPNLGGGARRTKCCRQRGCQREPGPDSPTARACLWKTSATIPARNV